MSSCSPFSNVLGDGGSSSSEDTGKNCSRGHWRPAEDDKLRQLVEQLGPRNWNSIAEHIEGRTGKSCRLRWFNQLDPRINRKPFSDEEEEKLLGAHRRYGNKWSLIARIFPGRTDNAVKNHYHVIVARQHRERPRRNTDLNNDNSISIISGGKRQDSSSHQFQLGLFSRQDDDKCPYYYSSAANMNMMRRSTWFDFEKTQQPAAKSSWPHRPIGGSGTFSPSSYSSTSMVWEDLDKTIINSASLQINNNHNNGDDAVGKGFSIIDQQPHQQPFGISSGWKRNYNNSVLQFPFSTTSSSSMEGAVLLHQHQSSGDHQHNNEKEHEDEESIQHQNVPFFDFLGVGSA